jgi:NADH dehydrogenase FAD-containing subunit
MPRKPLTAGVAAARHLASQGGVVATLVGETGVTPYTRMLIKGVAFGPTPPGFITLRLPEVEYLADTVTGIDPGDREVRLTSGRGSAMTPSSSTPAAGPACCPTPSSEQGPRWSGGR